MAVGSRVILVGRMKQLRKAGLVILLVVCFTVGMIVWGGHGTNSDTPGIAAMNEEEQPVSRQDSRRILEGVKTVTSEATRPRASTEEVVEATQEAVKTKDTATLSDCLKWCRRGNTAKPPYYVVAVLLVRIYYIDPAKLTTREMLQWLQYLRYAGVEHVYVYDAYVHKNESQVKALEPFLDNGYVTYIDWSSKAYPYSIQGTQVAAYRHCMDTYGKDTVWQAAIDIDEYPFSSSDTSENFLARFLHQFSDENRDAVEITMLNFLFLGKPLSEEEHPLLIDRLYRRTHRPANALVKPIYMPSRLSGTQVHHNYLRSGRSINAPEEKLRMNHYWGARLQNWGEDTPEVLAKTREDRSMGYIVRQIQHCSACLDPDILYRKRWN